uniref:CRAL-TRIO domain-containing protein n=1 Tax=Sexangularia sp. CB-2014 TaxID=1486929 RepID=A0A7S1VS02_9EUKA|mmetsp:Transcript_8811/g.28116  ORF Transcript_8811/g.28116 Transcript_8811/m.28116 type:complete len:366 (+) Transcript_8811:114-1211(+)
MADAEISSLVDAAIDGNEQRSVAQAAFARASAQEQEAGRVAVGEGEIEAQAVPRTAAVLLGLQNIVSEVGEVERPRGDVALAIEEQLRFAPVARARHQPTADALATALAEIGEGDAAAQAAAIAELREAARSAGLQLSSESNEYLRSFLRGRKYRQDEALETLTNYETMNGLTNWRWLTASHPVVQAELREGLVRLLPTRCARGGESIIIFDSRKLTKEKLTVGLGTTIMARHYLLESLLTDSSIATGLVAIMDGRGLGLSLLPHVNREEMRLNAFMLERMMPLRLRGIYIVNAPWFFRLFWNIMSSFMSAKTRERMRIVSSTEELATIFGPANLPPDYGGTLDFDVEKEIDQAVQLEQAVRSQF